MLEDVDDGRRGRRGDFLREGVATEPVDHDSKICSVVEGHVEAASVHRLSRDKMEDKIRLLSRKQRTARFTFGNQISDVRSVTWPIVQLTSKSFGLCDTWVADVEER